jgi:hypothetical protein
MTTTHTYRPGDIVRTQDGREFEVAGYNGDCLHFARMGSMQRNASMVTLVYRQPTRPEVEAMREEINRLRADVAQLTRNRDFWRGIAGHGEGEGETECNS